jgi:hypothetical protein
MRAIGSIRTTPPSGDSMLNRARQPLACLALIALTINLTYCRSVRKREAVEVVPPGTTGLLRQRVVGITFRDGTEKRFDNGVVAFIANDSIHSTVAKEKYGAPLADVQRVWVEVIDPVKTTAAVIGVTVITAVALAGAVVAMKESCPFVYSWDGSRYVFDAEPYGGAITRGLERDDYGDLEHLRPDSAGMYRLLVTNEVNEIQYTNAMRLIVVDHRPGASFEMDEWGQLHAVTSAVPPRSAVDQDRRDLVPWLRANDALIWEPLPPADPAGSVRQEIVLTFPKPHGATQGKLIARVATGLWGSHMIREMLDLRGSAVTEWYAAVDTVRAAQDSLRAWNVREELYVLKIDVDESGSWQPRALLPGGGPFISETRVVPLDVSRAVGDSVRLRIRPPSGFWALNSFAMSYPDHERPIAVDTLPPLTARTSDGRDVLPDLAMSDDRYYPMPTTSDRAVVSFRAPPSRPGTERKVFLHTRGYYRLYLDEVAAPDLVTLRRITEEPDAAARMAAASLAKQRLAGGGR